MDIHPILRARILSCLPSKLISGKIFRKNKNLHDNNGLVSESSSDLTSKNPSSDSLVKVGFIALEETPLWANFRDAAYGLGLTPILIDPTSVKFFENIAKANLTAVFVRPDYSTKIIRSAFDEKIRFIRDLDYLKVFPSELELRIYESKRSLFYFLKLNAIPHPKTEIFFRHAEAISYLEGVSYPLVVKTNAGAASSGVEIVKSKLTAKAMVSDFFKYKYYSKKVRDLRDFDYGYMIIQEYVKNLREFRVVKIGESWFVHEKIATKGEVFISGSGEKSWDLPDLAILDFCEGIADQHRFDTIAMDIFATDTGEYLVNELQAWFGHSTPNLMLVDGKKGRFLRGKSGWEFEEGDFNKFGSMKLRIAASLSLDVTEE
jgi:glutathione synthase/RimK-type ligase-like ATP-grasp enzyme